MKITGRLIDESGKPLANLTVQPWYYNVLRGPRNFGDAAQTATDGTFSFTRTITTDLSAGVVLINLHVRAFSAMGRLLLLSKNRDLTFIGQDWPIGDLTIHSKTVAGWRVTNRDPGGNQPFYSEANFAVPLIDNEVAWPELSTSVLASQKEANFLSFFFSIGDVILAFGPNEPVMNGATKGILLEDNFLTINREPKLAPVRILSRKAVVRGGPQANILNPEIGLAMSAATRTQVFFALPSSQPNSVKTVPYECSVRLPMHAKAVMLDGVEAHLMGSPLEQQYYDSTAHPFDNPKRGQAGSIRVPIHDVSLKIQGEAVPHVADAFNSHWAAAGATPLPPEASTPSTTPNAPIQIVRTLPGDRFNTPLGEMGILEAYQRVFEKATDYIYLETQYFVNRRIMAAIRAALKDPLRPQLQIIACINISVDIPLYNGYQRERIPVREKDEVPQLLQALQDDGTQSRFGVFCLWTHEARDPKHLLIRNYIHAKVALADDKWMTIGSANLDGVSLDASDSYFFSPKWPESEWSRRATEVNALIFNNADTAATSPLPLSFRKALWGEHLGADADLDNRPGGGWLSLWTEKATDKLGGLNATPPQVFASRILKWNGETDPIKYLKAAGVTDPLKFDVRKRVRSFDFTNGVWKE